MQSQTGTAGWRASYRASEHGPQSMSSGHDPIDGCRFSDKIMLEPEVKPGARPPALISYRAMGGPAESGAGARLLPAEADGPWYGIGVAVEIVSVRLVVPPGPRGRGPGMVHELGRKAV